MHFKENFVPVCLQDSRVRLGGRVKFCDLMSLERLYCFYWRIYTMTLLKRGNGKQDSTLGSMVAFLHKAAPIIDTLIIGTFTTFLHGWGSLANLFLLLSCFHKQTYRFLTYDSRSNVDF